MKSSVVENLEYLTVEVPFCRFESTVTGVPKYRFKWKRSSTEVQIEKNGVTKFRVEVGIKEPWTLLTFVKKILERDPFLTVSLRMNLPTYIRTEKFEIPPTWIIRARYTIKDATRKRYNLSYLGFKHGNEKPMIDTIVGYPSLWFAGSSSIVLTALIITGTPVIESGQLTGAKLPFLDWEVTIELNTPWSYKTWLKEYKKLKADLGSSVDYLNFRF